MQGERKKGKKKNRLLFSNDQLLFSLLKSLPQKRLTAQKRLGFKNGPPSKDAGLRGIKYRVLCLANASSKRMVAANHTSAFVFKTLNFSQTDGHILALKYLLHKFILFASQQDIKYYIPIGSSSKQSTGTIFGAGWMQVGT